MSTKLSTPRRIERTSKRQCCFNCKRLVNRKAYAVREWVLCEKCVKVVS